MHQRLQEAITWILAALVRVLQKMHPWIFAKLRLPFKELIVSASLAVGLRVEVIRLLVAERSAQRNDEDGLSLLPTRRQMSFVRVARR